MFNRDKDSDLNDEIRSHLQMSVSDRIQRGEDPRDARNAAMREFGNVGLVQQVTREIWSGRSVEVFLQDVRYGFRILRNNPGFTLVAILALGLGIGANTALFSMVYGVLLKPLPYPGSEQLQRLDRVTPQNPQGRISAADYLDLRREMQTYGDIGAYALGDTSLSDEPKLQLDGCVPFLGL